MEKEDGFGLVKVELRGMRDCLCGMKGGKQEEALVGCAPMRLAIWPKACNVIPGEISYLTQSPITSVAYGERKPGGWRGNIVLHETLWAAWMAGGYSGRTDDNSSRMGKVDPGGCVCN